MTTIMLGPKTKCSCGSWVFAVEQETLFCVKCGGKNNEAVLVASEKDITGIEVKNPQYRNKIINKGANNG
jgi:Zn finger protein HypA/HybF involved in hydrogenase expression